MSQCPIEYRRISNCFEDNVLIVFKAIRFIHFVSNVIKQLGMHLLQVNDWPVETFGSITLLLIKIKS